MSLVPNPCPIDGKPIDNVISKINETGSGDLGASLIVLVKKTVMNRHISDPLGAKISYQHALILLKFRRIEISNDTSTDCDIDGALGYVYIFSSHDICSAAVQDCD